MDLSVSPWAAASRMPEDRGPDSLESHLRAMLAELGLWGWHGKTSIGSVSGWVDWVILGPGPPYALFRELKTQDGTVTPEQRLVGIRLIRAGSDYAVWRPIDFLNGTMRRQLEAVALR